MNKWWKKGSHSADILVVGAHPDDAELLAGGSIAKMTLSGKELIIADMTQAELSTNGNKKSRIKETNQASEILKIKNRVNFCLKDGFLNREAEMCDKLVALIREVKPKLILAPPLGCRHPDHEALASVIKDAVYYSGLKKYLPKFPYCKRPNTINYFEVEGVKPNFCIDISDTFEIKMKAIMAYDSQFVLGNKNTKTYINSGIVDMVERRCRDWGGKLGVEYAEPFLCDNPLLLDSFILG
jgi:bacillithiol biosynthesis deacetylase BshB1